LVAVFLTPFFAGISKSEVIILAGKLDSKNMGSKITQNMARKLLEKKK
jgi:hypothetical protein